MSCFCFCNRKTGTLTGPLFIKAVYLTLVLVNRKGNVKQRVFFLKLITKWLKWRVVKVTTFCQIIRTNISDRNFVDVMHKLPSRPNLCVWLISGHGWVTGVGFSSIENVKAIEATECIVFLYSVWKSAGTMNIQIRPIDSRIFGIVF